MSAHTNIHQSLITPYTQLPWYKKIIFWLTAPRLAWGLFGYKQYPDNNRVNQLILWAKASWFFSTAFELVIYNLSRTSLHPLLNVNFVNGIMRFVGSKQTNTHERDEVADTKRVLELASTHSVWHESIWLYTMANNPRLAFTKEKLLEAVAYGRESRAVNIDKRKAGEIYAKGILRNYPDMSLEKGNLTDWGGRTFKNISAFQYALWAKDFKMMEMMLDCIPETHEGDEIRAQLSEQAKQVMAPAYAGGGVTYTHTFERPNLDALGIPNGTTTRVTEVHTENHFSIEALCDAYQNITTISMHETSTYLINVIGKLQRLLPVHVLQRYCDPDTPFYLCPQFDSEFKRSVSFHNTSTGSKSSLLNSSLSSDFALLRFIHPYAISCRIMTQCIFPKEALAIRRLDEVSMNEIEKISRQLELPRNGSALKL